GRGRHRECEYRGCCPGSCLHAHAYTDSADCKAPLPEPFMRRTPTAAATDTNSQTDTNTSSLNLTSATGSGDVFVQVDSRDRSFDVFRVSFNFTSAIFGKEVASVGVGVDIELLTCEWQ